MEKGTYVPLLALLQWTSLILTSCAVFVEFTPSLCDYVRFPPHPKDEFVVRIISHCMLWCWRVANELDGLVSMFEKTGYRETSKVRKIRLLWEQALTQWAKWPYSMLQRQGKWKKHYPIKMSIKRLKKHTRKTWFNLGLAESLITLWTFVVLPLTQMYHYLGR